MQRAQANQFLLAALKLGRVYLSCGGSISNLEESLTRASTHFGLHASVHATPTSITISCIDSHNNDAKSLSTRIGRQDSHLGRLAFISRLLEMFSKGLLLPEKASALIGKEWTNKDYPREIVQVAIFLVGFSVSYSRTLDWGFGVIGGVVTILSSVFGSLLLKFFKVGDSIKEFLMCFIAISMSTLLASYLRIHPSQLFIGTLALVLPGLTLTSAIGDLIEENFHTGLVKLAKTVLTLLSIGFAYLLSTDWLSGLGYVTTDLIIAKIESIPQVFASFCSTLGLIVGFCILLKVPRKAILQCVLIGSAGWVVFRVSNPGGHPYAASFLSALIVSVLSRVLSRYKRIPMQVYVIPSILVMVPGLLAFSYLQPLVDEASLAHASRSVLSSIMIAAALSFGLLVGQLRWGKQPELAKGSW
ncbi:MAG: threonine/serine exporter family protein [Bdellovibrionaceae bacterium]|nr:threonine/serine exporter family protein [Pseudobdellovibrionaceae bacterium]